MQMKQKFIVSLSKDMLHHDRCKSWLILFYAWCLISITKRLRIWTVMKSLNRIIYWLWINGKTMFIFDSPTRRFMYHISIPHQNLFNQNENYGSLQPVLSIPKPKHTERSHLILLLYLYGEKNEKGFLKYARWISGYWSLPFCFTENVSHAAWICTFYIKLFLEFHI